MSLSLKIIQSPNIDCIETASKENRLLGLVLRSLLLIFYYRVVRVRIAANGILCSSLAKDKLTMKKVQRRSTKFFPTLKTIKSDSGT